MELSNIENYYVIHWRGNLEDSRMLLQYTADNIAYKPFEYHRYIKHYFIKFQSSIILIYFK